MFKSGERERERERPCTMQKVESACHFDHGWNWAQGVPSVQQNTKMILTHPPLQTILGTGDHSYPERQHKNVYNMQIKDHTQTWRRKLLSMHSNIWSNAGPKRKVHRPRIQ